MSPIQEALLSLALAIPAVGVWQIVLTGRLPAGEPEDESDERLSRLFLGVLALALGGFVAVSSLGTLPTLVGGLIAVGAAFLVATAFVPILGRRRR